jgi:hypothetical protein
VLYAYFYSPEHATKYFLELIKKWEKNNTNCNMVHVEPCKNKKKNEEVDVRVVTQGGVKTEEDFDHGEGLHKKPNGKTMKAPHPPPKSDVAQHKQFLRDAQRELEGERGHEDIQCTTKRSLEEAQI